MCLGAPPRRGFPPDWDFLLLFRFDRRDRMSIAERVNAYFQFLQVIVDYLSTKENPFLRAEGEMDSVKGMKTWLCAEVIV